MKHEHEAARLAAQVGDPDEVADRHGDLPPDRRTWHMSGLLTFRHALLRELDDPRQTEAVQDVLFGPPIVGSPERAEGSIRPVNPPWPGRSGTCGLPNEPVAATTPRARKVSPAAVCTRNPSRPWASTAVTGVAVRMSPSRPAA